MDKEPIHLIFATGNPHKLSELQQMLVSLNIQLHSLTDINWHSDIEETESTLEGNSSLKARTIHKATDKNVFAEDTGLEVYALNMEPGVLTARYAGENKKADDNMSLLLSNLQTKDDRRARFRTIITLIWNNNEYQFEGICEGHIVKNLKGNGGFGYDPIFQPEGYDQTFGELGNDIKNKISHRYRALEKMLQLFKNENL